VGDVTWLVDPRGLDFLRFEVQPDGRVYARGTGPRGVVVDVTLDPDRAAELARRARVVGYRDSLPPTPAYLDAWDPKNS
jgi:hypothetical protein